MTRFDLLALLMVSAAAAGFINYKWLRLPSAIGLLVVSLALSVGIVILGRVFGASGLTDFAQFTVGLADLPSTLLDGALGFLLFASSMQVDVGELRDEAWTVFALATVGVLLATLFFGGAIYGVFHVTGLAVPLGWCFVLGAILASTDAVAITGILTRMNLPTGLRAIIVGESLFNDGVSIVVFVVALTAATGAGAVTPSGILIAFIREGLGGVALGWVGGWIAIALLRRIDDYNIELMITLALVAGVYAAARHAGASGPIAEVVAGIFIGNRGTKEAMNETSRRNVSLFWSLINEVLNALLFLLIGLEMVFIKPAPLLPVVIACAIPLSVVVRFFSTAIPAAPLHLASLHHLRNLTILTWGGLRGGIAVALALSLPPSPYRDELLAVCYAVVVFTIIVQGLTMPWLIRRLFGERVS